MKLYFETNEEATEWRDLQKCHVRIYYNKDVQAYYSITIIKTTLFNIYKPKDDSLSNSQLIFNNYCHILDLLIKTQKIKGISQNEKKQLPKFQKKFMKFQEEFRGR